jgi:hypothetical protein
MEHADMTRTTKPQQEAAARLAAALDAGIDHFGQHPDDDMATVHRHANRIYPEKAEALEFAYGVRIAGYGPSKYGAAEYLSTHNSKREALAQMKLYQAADKRRSK